MIELVIFIFAMAVLGWVLVLVLGTTTVFGRDRGRVGRSAEIFLVLLQVVLFTNVNILPDLLMYS
ncbi:MAG TPA: hypothetical protein VH796_18035 [Nitrososphaeraceae archaeon]